MYMLYRSTRGGGGDGAGPTSAPLASVVCLRARGRPSWDGRIRKNQVCFLLLLS
jgi:hypothetical protein